MRFQCPQCEFDFDVPDDYPEDVVACEKCGTKLSIRPASPILMDPPAAAGPSRYRDRAGASDPQALLDGMTTSIDEFWEETHATWLSGRIHSVIPKASEAAKAVDVSTFAAQFVEKKYKALFFLLREFGPLEEEFYSGGDEKDCTVTNFRLVMRDPDTRSYRVIPLAMLTGQVDEKGWWTKTPTYHLKSGKTLTFRKLGSFIPDKNIQALQALGDCYSLGDELTPLIGNVKA